jgi:hypothetical protein
MNNEENEILELKGIYKLLIYADVNLLGDDTHTTMKNTEVLLDNSK